MHYTQHLLIDTQRYLDISMHRYSICSIDMHIELLCIAMHRCMSRAPSQYCLISNAADEDVGVRWL